MWRIRPVQDDVCPSWVFIALIQVTKIIHFVCFVFCVFCFFSSLWWLTISPPLLSSLLSHPSSPFILPTTGSTRKIHLRKRSRKKKRHANNCSKRNKISCSSNRSNVQYATLCLLSLSNERIGNKRTTRLVAHAFVSGLFEKTDGKACFSCVCFSCVCFFGSSTLF